MEDCIFCKMIAGEIPCNKVYEDELVLAFYDINPAAPLHILVIPKKHFENILALGDEDMKYFAAVKRAVEQITKEKGVDKEGFRLVVNTGDNGGQTVHHLHFHILGGKKLSEKMD